MSSCFGQSDFHNNKIQICQRVSRVNSIYHIDIDSIINACGYENIQSIITVDSVEVQVVSPQSATIEQVLFEGSGANGATAFIEVDRRAARFVYPDFVANSLGNRVSNYVISTLAIGSACTLDSIVLKATFRGTVMADASGCATLYTGCTQMLRADGPISNDYNVTATITAIPTCR